MFIVDTPNRQICPGTAEMGRAVTMSQVKAFLAQRRPTAKPLPKIVRRKR